MTSLASTYDKAYSQWDVSGRHQGIAFADFKKGSGWVLYVHELLESIPGLFASVKNVLPDDVFMESAGSGSKSGKKELAETERHPARLLSTVMP